MIAFEPVIKGVLFLHLVAAVAVVSSSVHLFARLVKAMRRKGGYIPQVRLHARILLASYLTVTALGGMVYPTFRVRVRHDFLDANVPWATGLFEVKELLTTVGILPVIAIFLLARAIDFGDSEHRPHQRLLLYLTGFVFAVVGFNAWCGWYLATIRPV